MKSKSALNLHADVQRRNTLDKGEEEGCSRIKGMINAEFKNTNVKNTQSEKILKIRKAT